MEHGARGESEILSGASQWKSLMARHLVCTADTATVLAAHDGDKLSRAARHDYP